MLWTGDELIVAFTDLLDVRYRAFDRRLRPLGDVRTLGASPAAIESSVALARFDGHWAAAYRENEDAFDRIRLLLAVSSWSTPPAPPAPAGDRPALVALDDQHLLVLYTIGTDPLATGNPTVSRLRLALLSIAMPGEVEVLEFVPTLEPYADDATLAQRRPAATRAGARVYLAWESESPDFDERASELFVARVELDAEDESFVQHPEQPFPPGVSRAGSQRNPHLASNDLFPEGAVIMLFEDRPLGANSDVLLDYRPSPFVWLE